MREKKAKEMVKYNFTDKEKKEFGESMAQAYKKKTSLELGLKSVSTQFKSDIAREEANIDSLAEKLQSGYEYREVLCRLDYEEKKKIVKYVCTDGGNIVRERPMRPDEFQKNLPLGSKGEK